MTFKYFKREYELSKLMDTPLDKDIQTILELFEDFFDQVSIHQPDIYLSKGKNATLRLDPICSEVNRIVYLTFRNLIGRDVNSRDFAKILHFWFLDTKNVDISGLSFTSAIE